MEFSELTIRLLLIFFPGMIAMFIINNLTTHKRNEFNIFLLHSFLMGLVSYFTAYFVVMINNWILILNGYSGNKKLQFLESLTNGKSAISIREVLLVTLLAIILAIVISLVINRGWFHLLARKLKITNQFGEKDVWQHMFNSPNVEWISVRDFENDLIFQGHVAAFSDTSITNELLLQDVIVYASSTGEELYHLDAIYITRKTDSLTIEVQQFKNI